MVIEPACWTYTFHMTLPPWPHFEPDEVAAATAVLESGRVNAWTGDDCRAFEAAYAAACDVEHALCLANGSLALEAALGATGIEAGDDVLVTPRSFVASASFVSRPFSGAPPFSSFPSFFS